MAPEKISMLLDAARLAICQKCRCSEHLYANYCREEQSLRSYLAANREEFMQVTLASEKR